MNELETMEYGVSTGAYVFAILALIYLAYIGFKFSKGEMRFRGDNPKMSDQDKARVNSQYRFFIILAIVFTAIILFLYQSKNGM